MEHFHPLTHIKLKLCYMKKEEEDAEKKRLLVVSQEV
jgi:hypothetical protein